MFAKSDAVQRLARAIEPGRHSSDEMAMTLQMVLGRSGDMQPNKRYHCPCDQFVHFFPKLMGIMAFPNGERADHEQTEKVSGASVLRPFQTLEDNLQLRKAVVHS